MLCKTDKTVFIMMQYVQCADFKWGLLRMLQILNCILKSAAAEPANSTAIRKAKFTVREVG